MGAGAGRAGGQASGLQRSGRTNLLRLARFHAAAEEDGGGEAGPGKFKETDDVGPCVRGVVALLRGASDHILPETDCKRNMGRHVPTRRSRSLCGSSRPLHEIGRAHV